MRKSYKRLLAVLLSFLLAFGALSVVSFAENGPCDTAFAFIRLVELNDDGTSKRDSEGYVYKLLYQAEHGPFEPQPLDQVDGIVYDKKTNTLTLTDFDGGKYLLSANMMGDDFVVALEGDNSLGYMTVWGDMWGGSLRVSGNGSLTVNEKKTADHAIEFHPEGVDVQFAVDEDATLKLYARESVVVVDGTEQTASPFALDDAVETKKENYVAHRQKEVFGYDVNPLQIYEVTYPRAVCRDDPDGLYTIFETTIWREGEDPVNKIEVKHLWYSEKYDQHFEDVLITGEYGPTELYFDSFEEAKAAGYEPMEGADNVTVRTGGGNGFEDVYIGPDGNEYVVTYTKLGGDNYGRACARVEPLPGAEDMYIFVVDTSVSEADLTETYEDIEFDDVFTWTVPGTELVIAPQQQPPAHEHAFELKKDATGHWQECACGEIKDKAAHTPGDWIVDKAPTATEGGLQHKECTVCGYVTTSVTTLPTGEQPPEHEHTPEVIPGRDATCTQDGLTDGERCSVCGEILKAQEVIPASGHKSAIRPGSPSTCLEDGYTDSEYCEICGETLRARMPIPATGHTDENKDGKCDVCGADLSALAGLRGDADLDGKVLAKDARLVLRASARLEKLEGQAFINCDLDGNGKLLASEARMILRFSAKLEKQI